MRTFIESRRGANVFAILAGLAAVIAVFIVGLRLISVIRFGDVFTTTGTERVDQYAIWKLQNGHPLYEWPDRYPYAFTPYNFLFYICYAGTARLAHLAGPETVLLTRLLTLFGALVGALAQYRLTVLLVRDAAGARAKWLLLCFALLVWLGQDFLGWYVLTTRPDTWAAALATIGLLFYIRATKDDASRFFLATSLAFFLAWSFKQVMVWTLLGTSLHALLIRRSLRDFALLTIPCGIMMAACLLIGGPVYRYNIIVAQSLGQINMSYAARLFALAIATNPFVWLLALFAAAAWFSSRRIHTLSEDNLLSGLSPVVFVLVVALVMGVVALGRAGSRRNQIVEAFVAAGTISSVIAVRIFQPAAVEQSHSPRPMLRWAGLLLLAATVVGGAIHLVVPWNEYGLLRFTRPLYEAQKASFDRIARLPKPLWSSFEAPMVPWIATDDRYPMIPIVEFYYDVAKSRGLLRDGGLEAMLADGQFKSLLLETSHPLYDVALAHGYRVVGETSFPMGPTVKILVKADQADTQP